MGFTGDHSHWHGVTAFAPGDMGWPRAQRGRAGIHGSCHHLKRVVKFGGSLVPWLLESGEDGGK